LKADCHVNKNDIGKILGLHIKNLTLSQDNFSLSFGAITSGTQPTISNKKHIGFTTVTEKISYLVLKM
jgi:hypothetical protein